MDCHAIADLGITLGPEETLPRGAERVALWPAHHHGSIHSPNMQQDRIDRPTPSSFGHAKRLDGRALAGPGEGDPHIGNDERKQESPEAQPS